MKSNKKLITLIVGLFLLITIVLPISLLVFVQTFAIDGPAMEPTYKSGDKVLVSKKIYSVNRDDIIVYQAPENSEYRGNLAHRAVGVPGDTVIVNAEKIEVTDSSNKQVMLISTNGKAFNQAQYVLTKNQYFMMGDNTGNALDSLTFGPVKKDNIIGEVIYKLP